MFINFEIPDDKTVIIDCDSMVYKIGNIVDMMPDINSRRVKYMVDEYIAKIYEETNVSRSEIYLGSDTNYRYNIATMLPYKGNRNVKDRPEWYDAIRAYLVSEFGAKIIQNREAEDEVGIRAFQHDSYNDYIIAAIDKDIRMIPGYHYNYVNGSFDYVDKVQAARNFYLQLVTGDKASDNIPGLYHQLELDGDNELAHKFRYSRYKKKLLEILDNTDDANVMYSAVLKLYEDYGQIKKHGLKRIQEVGQLLWIQREEGKSWSADPDKQDIITSVKFKEPEVLDERVKQEAGKE